MKRGKNNDNMTKLILINKTREDSREILTDSIEMHQVRPGAITFALALLQLLGPLGE